MPPEATRYDKLSRFNEMATHLTPKFVHALARLSKSLLLTNLGRFPFPEKYGELHLRELFFVPPPSIMFELVLGVVTAADRLNLSICHLEEVIDTFTVDRLKDRAMEHLRTAIAA